MSETKHTLSQIWNDGVMIKANGALIGQTLSEEYARRIVACVNACAGIETVHLEKYGLPDFAQKISDLREQRDQLLAALKAAADELREQKRSIGFRAHTLAVIEQAEAAIARVKGSTS